MTLGHGPKIITKGLVFAYDMGPNPGANKSWKGAPTFNASLLNGQNDVSPWSGDGTPTSLGIDSSVKFRGRKVAKFQTGSSGNCYINGAGDLSTGTTSTVWTTTIYLKRVDNTPLTSVGMYQYITNNSNVNVTRTLTLVEDGWYKAVYTRSGLSAGYPSLTGMYSLGVGNQYYFADWQCENNLYSTPWVSGTRSNTQALLDWTGNHTITASALTYNSDGSFDFNGANNYITLPSDAGYTATFSQFAWFKSSGNPLGGYNIIFGGSQAEISIPTAGALRIGVTTPTRYVGNLGSGLTDASWHHIGMVYNPANSYIEGYIDGASVGTVATTGLNPTASFTRTMGRFGTSGSYYANGNISSAQIYNTPLTAAEVQQNFQALRGRYGI
tara:strand:+ start:789 stop:1940 length:1152 start_codon:yes stop_codon:yes gene_type:complete